MSGPRSTGSRIGQTVMLVAVSIALALSAGPIADRAAAGQATAPVADPVPLHVLASGEGSLPAAAEVVWLVQRGATSGERRVETPAFPLGFALAQRGGLAILGKDGARIAELAPGRAGFLPSGVTGAYASATGDLALFVQIALAPVSTLPNTLPPMTIASEPFAAPDATIVRLELLRGILNPGRTAAVSTPDQPMLVLAIDSTLHVAADGAAPVGIVRDEAIALTTGATIHNRGTRPATFVVARIVPSAPPTGSDAPDITAQPLDPQLDDAWRRLGCHLNPANPSCLTVGLAVDCAIDAAAPGCDVDGDGDGCRDVAEVRAGFDAFDPADCLGSGQGEPAVNCLFVGEDIACDGRRDVADEESGCVAAREIRLRRNPSNLFGCGETGERPPVDCALFERDPRCDGFALDEG